MRRFAVLALLLGLLAGCGAEQAATGLPEEMPADFEIRYENWIDEESPNIYDTGEKLLQKDLVNPDGQRTAQAELNISDETRQEIYAKVRVCALDRLTKAIHTTDETEASMTPLRRYKVTFIADGETYAITGDTMVREYAKTNGVRRSSGNLSSIWKNCTSTARNICPCLKHRAAICKEYATRNFPAPHPSVTV